MQNTLRHEVFPNIGIRSPILKSSVRNTRFAFYLTNAIIFFIILAVFGYVKYSQWQYQQRIAKFGLPLRTNVVVVSYTNLGPPPSITGTEVTSPSAIATRAITSVGVPKPVPDALAVQETSPDQTMISGITTINTNTSGNIVVDTMIPQINAYVPHEVEPKFLYQPALVYPSAARSFGYEGTTFIKALLDLDGSVMRIAVVKSSGFPILDSAAVDYIASAKFSPALQQKKPVRVWIGQTITFQLKSGINK
jgi:periplasmic protein TonB